MNATAKFLTVFGMLATVAWFFWNPKGWTFQWEPIVVFLLTLAGFVGAEITGRRYQSKADLSAPRDGDVLLLRELIQLLPSDGVIDFLRHHDFLNDFELDAIGPLREFLHRWDNAEHEFHNAELEQLRKELISATEGLSHSISKYTSSNKTGIQAVRVDRLKHIAEHEERFRREADIINSAADEVVQKHQELIRTGRRSFVIDVS